MGLVVMLVITMSCEKKPEDKPGVFLTPFELSEGLQTATYEECINFYKELARAFAQINIQTIGSTDSGYPLHIVTFNPESEFNFQKLAANKTIILINNGIHPGESDGIDATMMLYRDLALERMEIPENVVVATIPVYNVGGALNRNSHSRVNQNGPESYGFRGNARNYDLNRDFVKSDTRNSKTFSQIYHLLKPDVFVETHVSNGADYQYVLSHLFTQHNKMGGALGSFIEEKMIPELEQNMEEADWPLVPYVNIFNTPPNVGFAQFLDHPRYSTGYVSLWNTIGLMIESHMLKPYDQRVAGTMEFLHQIISFCDKEHENIKELRAQAWLRLQQAEFYPISWELDSSRVRTLQFKGFQADTITSQITGQQRLLYQSSAPKTFEVPYFNHYRSKDSIEIPAAYVIGKQWEQVVERLELNGIAFRQFEQDTLIRVESYRIGSYDTSPAPYEGHYPHFNTRLVRSIEEKEFKEGDYLISTDQEGIRYLIETLEPSAVDSFFNWNFFDSVLQQKEGFSPYVFEDLALEILKENPVLKDSLESRKANDASFEANWYAQLEYVYKQSEYYEAAHLQYPVYRIALP